MSKKSILNKYPHSNPRMLKLKIRIRIRGCEKTDIWHIPTDYTLFTLYIYIAVLYRNFFFKQSLYFSYLSI